MGPWLVAWDYRAGRFHRRMGLRIDLALLSPDVAERLVARGSDRAVREGPRPSDHAPLPVELRLSRAVPRAAPSRGGEP